MILKYLLIMSGNVWSHILLLSVATVTPPPVPVISPPSQVQGVMITRSGTSLTVSWTAVTVTDPKYAILYVVRYSTDYGTQTDPPSDAMKKSGISATSTTLTGLQLDTIYYVWVAAEILGAGVQGPYSTRFPNHLYSMFILHNCALVAGIYTRTL